MAIKNPGRLNRQGFFKGDEAGFKETRRSTLS